MDGGVVFTDVEDLVALQVQVAIEGFDEHLVRATRALKVPGAWRLPGVFNFRDKRGWLQGYEGELCVWRCAVSRAMLVLVIRRTSRLTRAKFINPVSAVPKTVYLLMIRKVVCREIRP
jgi:hypothetical protein